MGRFRHYAGPTGAPGTFFELPGPGVPGAFLDSNPTTGPVNNRINSSTVGRYGAAVTFWGAQWAALNTLSSGTAPSSFKGFAAATTEPPAQGSTWTSGPGDSSGPPSPPLPAYMGVVVTDSITTPGRTISGDTVRIVVVKVDPGYGGDPGHAGTGRVVAVFG